MNGYRLVEVLEHGWDVMVVCKSCGAEARRSKAHFLDAWRKYLNATIEQLTERLKCPCGAQACRSYILGGSYTYFGMCHDYFAGRAILIRNTLTQAGLDPAEYGYPPLTDAPKVTHMPR